eukprot:Rmarinus@m.12392
MWEEEILNTVLNQIKRQQKLTEKDLEQLYVIYGNTLEGAIAVLESKRIIIAQGSPSGRKFTVIRGHKPYVCFRHYCSCPAFVNMVLVGKTVPHCKHQLAVRLAEALSRLHVTTVNDDELPKFVQGI